MADSAEFYKKIKSGLPGEINGIKEYINLAKMADDADLECWAEMLKDMAWEEHTHAKHMMHILDKAGIPYTEYVQAYNEANKMLHEYS